MKRTIASSPRLSANMSSLYHSRGGPNRAKPTRARRLAAVLAERRPCRYTEWAHAPPRLERSLPRLRPRFG
jgi:hypothetical protein